MKALGITLCVFGTLMLISTGNLALTKYDLNSTHDQGKLCGGILASALFLLGGFKIANPSKPKG
jgi:hypothetical protein